MNNTQKQKAAEQPIKNGVPSSVFRRTFRVCLKGQLNDLSQLMNTNKLHPLLNSDDEEMGITLGDSATSNIDITFVYDKKFGPRVFINALFPITGPTSQEVSIGDPIPE